MREIAWLGAGILVCFCLALLIVFSSWDEIEDSLDDTFFEEDDNE